MFRRSFTSLTAVGWLTPPATVHTSLANAGSGI